MVVLSFFLCYNVQQAQQKNKRREAAFVFLCLLQRANLLRSRRKSAEARGMDAEILHGERKRTQFL